VPDPRTPVAGTADTRLAPVAANAPAETDGPNWVAADRRSSGQPIWGPPPQRPSPRPEPRAEVKPGPPPATANGSRTGFGAAGRGGPNVRLPGWPAGHRSGRPDLKPHSAEDHRPDPWAAPPGQTPPAVRVPAQNSSRGRAGSPRRGQQSTRQGRPDLRVINGEGTGASLGRSGRLRAVPRKEPGS
jgi:hypothetical protein